MPADYTLDIPISFGHCDPAGIVFYPNYFRWFDRCFHSFLNQRAGGHRQVCEELGARGIGLLDVSARFPAPALQDDVMRLEMELADWGSKVLKLAYRGSVEGRVVVEGTELRGMFVMREGRMRAAELAPLRALLGAA